MDDDLIGCKLGKLEKDDRQRRADLEAELDAAAADGTTTFFLSARVRGSKTSFGQASPPIVTSAHR